MNNTTYKAPSPILAALAVLRKKHRRDSNAGHATTKARQADAPAGGLAYPLYVARHGAGVKGLL